MIRPIEVSVKRKLQQNAENENDILAGKRAYNSLDASQKNTINFPTPTQPNIIEQNHSRMNPNSINYTFKGLSSQGQKSDDGSLMIMMNSIPQSNQKYDK